MLSYFRGLHGSNMARVPILAASLRSVKRGLYFNPDSRNKREERVHARSKEVSSGTCIHDSHLSGDPKHSSPQQCSQPALACSRARGFTKPTIRGGSRCTQHKTNFLVQAGRQKRGTLVTSSATSLSLTIPNSPLTCRKRTQDPPAPCRPVPPPRSPDFPPIVSVSIGWL
jgi:hypothetical protein